MIDTHVHLWDPARGFDWLRGAPEPLRRPFTEQDLISASAPTTVSEIILVEAGSGHEQEAADLLALAARSEWISGVVAPLDWAADPLRALEDLDANPHARWLSGVRDSTRRPFRLPHRTTRVIERELARRGIAVDLMVSPETVDEAVRFVDRLPDVAVVVDHAANPPISTEGPLWDRWRTAIEILSRRPNVVVKISGLLTMAHPSDSGQWVGEVLLNAFGPARLMLGSDWPICLRAGSYAESLARSESVIAMATAPELDAIRFTTADRVYGLTRNR